MFILKKNKILVSFLVILGVFVIIVVTFLFYLLYFSSFEGQKINLETNKKANENIGEIEALKKLLDQKAKEFICIEYDFKMAEHERKAVGYGYEGYQEKYEKSKKEISELQKQYEEITGESYNNPYINMMPTNCSNVNNKNLSPYAIEQRGIIDLFNKWKDACLADDIETANNYMSEISKDYCKGLSYTDYVFKTLYKDSKNYVNYREYQVEYYYVIVYTRFWKNGILEEKEMIAYKKNGEWKLYPIFFTGTRESNMNSEISSNYYNSGKIHNLDLTVVDVEVYPKITQDLKYPYTRTLLITVLNNSRYDYIIDQFTTLLKLKDNDLVVDARHSAFLYPGEKKKLFINVNISGNPELFKPGLNNFQVIVDSENEIEEIDETNNIYNFSYSFVE